MKETRSRIFRSHGSDPVEKIGLTNLKRQRARRLWTALQQRQMDTLSQ